MICPSSHSYMFRAQSHGSGVWSAHPHIHACSGHTHMVLMYDLPILTFMHVQGTLTWFWCMICPSSHSCQFRAHSYGSGVWSAHPHIHVCSGHTHMVLMYDLPILTFMHVQGTLTWFWCMICPSSHSYMAPVVRKLAINSNSASSVEKRPGRFCRTLGSCRTVESHFHVFSKYSQCAISRLSFISVYNCRESQHVEWAVIAPCMWYRHACLCSHWISPYTYRLTLISAQLHPS